MSYKLPKDEHVGKMMTDLLGRNVKMAASKNPLAKDRKANIVVAEFCDSEGNAEVLLLADNSFVCLSGAALAMVPQGAALEAVRENTPPENLLEIYHEVANVLTATFRDDNVRLVLGAIHTELKNAPSDFQTAAKAAKNRLEMNLDITGYGNCRAALVAL